MLSRRGGGGLIVGFQFAIFPALQNIPRKKEAALGGFGVLPLHNRAHTKANTTVQMQLLGFCAHQWYFDGLGHKQDGKNRPRKVPP